jgi:hypothetical protein
MSSEATSGSWLVIDDVIKRYCPFWDESPPTDTTFVQQVPDALAHLTKYHYDVLSLDYNLSAIGTGTTQPLVSWLCETSQVKKYSNTMLINVHSSDHHNEQRITRQLTEAGYEVSHRAIS